MFGIAAWLRQGKISKVWIFGFLEGPKFGFLDFWIFGACLPACLPCLAGWPGPAALAGLVGWRGWPGWLAGSPGLAGLAGWPGWPGHARRRISLAALGMHARDTSFRVIWGAPPLAVGVHDYYAHARDAVMPGMRNMPIGGKACMPGMRARHTLGACMLVMHACPWIMDGF